jgi:hypothetical protein
MTCNHALLPLVAFGSGCIGAGDTRGTLDLLLLLCSAQQRAATAAVEGSGGSHAEENKRIGL